MCRRKKGSHRRRKAAKSTAQTHLKIARQRRDFHSKTAKQYAEHYQVIAVEKLQVLNMVQNHSLAKSIMDASWGAFLDILEEKAERAGHQVIRVNPRFTSQKCFKCGEIVQKSLVGTNPYLSFLWAMWQTVMSMPRRIFSNVQGQGMAFRSQRTPLGA